MDQSFIDILMPMVGARSEPRTVVDGPLNVARPDMVTSPCRLVEPREVSAATLRMPDWGFPLLKSENQSNPFNRIALVALAAFKAVTAFTPVQTTSVPL